MKRARVGALVGVLLACAFGTSAEATGGRTSRVFPDDELNTGRTLQAISGDGRWIAYTTFDHADPLNPTGVNSVLFVRDLQTDTDYRVTPPKTHFQFGGMSRTTGRSSPSRPASTSPPRETPTAGATASCGIDPPGR